MRFGPHTAAHPQDQLERIAEGYLWDHRPPFGRRAEIPAPAELIEAYWDAQPHPQLHPLLKPAQQDRREPVQLWVHIGLSRGAAVVYDVVMVPAV